jgi:predicted Rossmann fold flavoprotein
VIVLGGGAAGFFAAIACAESDPRSRVVIWERAGAVLSKVRVSGGGRCNVTHACLDPKDLIRNYPRGGDALRGPFHKFGPAQTLRWFEDRGVPLKVEEDGRVFPRSDRSQSIIDCLLQSARQTGVVVETGVRVKSIREREGRFVLETEGGPAHEADRLLLATGSSPQGWAWAEGLGHRIIPPVPSLFTFQIPEKRLQGLAGLSVEDACLSLPDLDIESRGPLLVTHWGLSGPAVLKLSAWAARELHARGYRARLRVDWTGRGASDAEKRLLREKESVPRRLVAGSGWEGVPHRLWERLVSSAGIPADRRWADLSREERTRLVSELTEGVYAVKGKGAFKEEFVTCGGVSLDEVDFRTLESRRRPGLHFAGEILDVDAVTGGFNFQNAWTTGWLAGRAMAGQK